jgi:hypothetical protein
MNQKQRVKVAEKRQLAAQLVKVAPPHTLRNRVMESGIDVCISLPLPRQSL